MRATKENKTFHKTPHNDNNNNTPTNNKNIFDAKKQILCAQTHT
jgi:hypothetical protein